MKKKIKVDLPQTIHSYMKLKIKESNITQSDYIKDLILNDLLTSLSIDKHKISKTNINSKIIADLKEELNVESNEHLIECLIKYYINHSIRGWNEWV